MPGEHLVNLAQIGEFIKNYQKTNQTKHPYKTRLDEIIMSQPKKRYPKLTGRAADIAGLHAAMHQLWTGRMDATDVRHRQIRLLLDLNHQILWQLETYSAIYGYMALPAGMHDEIFQKGLQIASLHNQLLEHYEAAGIQIFNMTSKTYFALHALQFSKLIHPFMILCYKGESAMHRIQVLWKSC